MTATSPTAADAASYERGAELLAPLPMPAHVLPGNHDDRASCARRSPAPPSTAPPTRRTGTRCAAAPLRLVGCDTTIPRHDRGQLDDGRRWRWLVTTLDDDLATPTIVAMHHRAARASASRALDAIGLPPDDRRRAQPACSRRRRGPARRARPRPPRPTAGDAGRRRRVRVPERAPAGCACESRQRPRRGPLALAPAMRRQFGAARAHAGRPGCVLDTWAPVRRRRATRAAAAGAALGLHEHELAVGGVDADRVALAELALEHAPARAGRRGASGSPA